MCLTIQKMQLKEQQLTFSDFESTELQISHVLSRVEDPDSVVSGFGQNIKI